MLLPLPDDLVHLHWRDFVSLLAESALQGNLESLVESRLSGWFDAEERQRLRTLTRRLVDLRATLPVLGNVVFVHGTMSADLATEGIDGATNLIWMNLPRLSQGQFSRLKLSPDGTEEADPTFPVRVLGTNLAAYAIPLLWLQARWNTLPYAYDWRKDLDLAADGLAEFIEAHFPDEPVHLVSHSMGGVVCRNFIHRHPVLWQRMRDPARVRGGRLIQMGTPNYGTFVVTQVLTGQSEIVWALDQTDLGHNSDELAEIASTFVANYQFMPKIGRPGGADPELYGPVPWGSLPVSMVHMARAKQFHQDLDADPITSDPERISYIAAYGVRTASGVTVKAPGQLEHRFNYRGDGVTSLDLGPLDGVPTWYIFTNHFELIAHPRVLPALDELLLTGQTLLLARRPLPTWIAQTAVSRAVQLAARWFLGRELQDTARHAASGVRDMEVQRGERVLLETVMGERRVLRRLWQLEVGRLSSFLTPRREIEL